MTHDKAGAGLGHAAVKWQKEIHNRCTTRGAQTGDVPGWVLVTLMSAGLVVALWALAGPALGDLFLDAINGVSGP